MEENSLAHYGTLRKSGRYPWGSGKNPHQRNRDLLSLVDRLREEKMSEAEIANALGWTTTELRARKAIAKTEQRQAQVAQALRLSKDGNSNVAIGKIMGIPESTVRNLLNPALQQRNDVLNTVSNLLRDHIKENGMVDIGVGVESHLGISKEKLATAAAMLQEEGYKIIPIQTQGSSANRKTIVKVLAPPGVEYKDIVSDPSKITQIKQVSAYSDDGGHSFKNVTAPVSFSSKRLSVKYGDEGGAEADGVIYVRPGVDDVSLGSSRYLQVRIAVDKTHYIKGMAMYRDDLPDGVDLVFNTAKTKNDIRTSPDYTGDVKLGALKKLKDDADLPFGSIVRQHQYTDANGKTKQSVINIVNEEANWDDWSKNLSSQMLSKQQPALIKDQLGMTYERRKAEYKEIMSLTNPAVKRKLLEEFADSTDSAAVHLKAAALPRQKTHVILPFSSIKEGEIYAPNYNNGESVVLIRYPHGGIFEIPELKVNNRNRAATAAIGTAKAAVGINPKTAQQLSGADFDGDTVLVIPNNSGRIRSKNPLSGLVGFEPKTRYPYYEGMKIMSNTQQEMGNISNLITDMTIKNATDSEIARAVRHSMVVIDAEKHKLNYRQSAKDNGILELKEKYQSDPNKPGSRGASTLISRATSEERVPDRRLRKASEGGPIDPETGEKVYTYSGDSYVRRTTSKKTGVVTERVIPKTLTSTKLAEAKDAHTLSSGTVREAIYADHSNNLKALANAARRESLNIKSTPYSPSAKAAYSKEVSSLSDKLALAQRNAPRERQALLLANASVRAKQDANPSLTAGEIKKLRIKALTDAREAVGANKPKVNITKTEWDAIQAGAITNNRLTEILRHADPKQVKELALPRQNTVMNTTMTRRAQAMLASGYTQAEIAQHLGVAASTLSTALGR